MEEAYKSRGKVELSSKTESMNEDALYLKVKTQCDELLIPNLIQIKSFKLSDKLRGNLLLVMYLLDSNLQVIFLKMQAPPKRKVRVVRLPKIYDTQKQCF